MAERIIANKHFAEALMYAKQIQVGLPPIVRRHLESLCINALLAGLRCK